MRQELCEEALWLSRQLHRLVPHDPETTGLLALLLLHGARSAARQDADGRLLSYDEQDRTLWSLAPVEQAKSLLATTGRQNPGPYQLQAAIALLHAVAPSADSVPWPRIAGLYEALYRAAPSPVVAVNRAVAVGRADGPHSGLEVLQPVLTQAAMSRYLPLHAAHADLLAQAGRPAEPPKPGPQPPHWRPTPATPQNCANAHRLRNPADRDPVSS